MLEAVASPVKSTTGATIWTELPDVSVTYSAVLRAESDAMMTMFRAKSVRYLHSIELLLVLRDYG